jgi:hypothetical protein
MDDLPPEGKVQMAAKVGVHITPEQSAVHDVAMEALKHIGKKTASTTLPTQRILNENA